MNAEKPTGDRRNRGLASGLVAQLVARSVEGATTPQLVEWLRSEHQLIRSARQIRRYLAEHVDDRHSAVRTAVAERLTPVVTGDLDELERIATRLRRIADKTESEHLGVAIRALVGEAHVRTTRLRIAGAQGADPAALPPSGRQKLLERLSRIVGEAS